ncbi:achaete-scute homolog 5-like [Centropristis striata]|uniref:achaete-scute homolog 5-like n=1 Tax=Centropristis striata TaxID=184440 RepID=UPI0027E0AFF0|nr:achaete-scute homolog 5-like [Centropristis striata]
MMSSSYLSFSMPPPAGHRDDRGHAPFLLYPGGGMEALLLPLPPLPPGVWACPLEPAFVQRRNERERQRVRCVNQGYAALRDRLPGHAAATHRHRLSKVETLRAAIRYIKYLQGLVAPQEDTPPTPPPV